jgi:hypothetical protein
MGRCDTTVNSRGAGIHCVGGHWLSPALNIECREGGLVGVLDVRARKTVLGILGGGAQGLLNNFFALVEGGRAQL